MSHLHHELHAKRIRNWKRHLGKRTLHQDHVVFSAEVATTDNPVPWTEKNNLEYRELKEGAGWGSTWQSAWFHIKAEVPGDWAGSYVVARIDLGGEILVFNDDGSPRCGLTHGSVFELNYAKDILHLIPKAEGAETVDLWLEAAANRLFGLHRCGDTEHLEDDSRLHGHFQGTIKAMRLYRFDYESWQLWLDIDVLFGIYEASDEKTARRARLIHALNAACDAYYTNGVAAARDILAPQLAVPSNPSTIDVTAIGHAHIDTGWLWPVRETIRKSARTFSSALEMIGRYPEYVFGASQPAHYRMIKEHYPALYERIKKAVADGRWELQGGMWIEADCNLIGGESMIRQFLHGKHFFMREFGVEVRNLWLPDVFGYNAQLPQVLQGCGCPQFLTQKLSWSLYNKFPHHTFNWRGLDGSEVVAHFPPEDNYNSPVTPASIRKCEHDYKDAGTCAEAVSLFGVGDGGGGPREDHIERALRMKDLNGVPRYKMGPAQPVLERLTANKEALDTWSGELYLELHRGTFTTQARTKLLMRRSEEALRATEMLCAAGDIDCYPHKELDELWKTVLLNQFHDILPGSSINMVYETTVKELQGVLDRCAQLNEAAAANLLIKDEGYCSYFNPSSTAFDDAVELPADWKGASLDGSVLASQCIDGKRIVRLNVAAQGFVTLQEDESSEERVSCDDRHILENDLVRYEFNDNLQLISGYDKVNQRDVLEGPGNELSLYEDRPSNWDAWEIDEWYTNARVGVATAAGPVENISGTVLNALRAKLSVEKAVITQTVTLRPGSPRLDFVTEVNWQERHRMLRVAFPTTVHTNEASFDIQYGTIRRPTHENTSWDKARFEVVGHRFADLSNSDWGVALLNDSKYGYHVKGNTLDLNLLRSPTDPDPIADLGKHFITYSLLPHADDLSRDDSVRREAAMLNQGVTALPGFAANDAVLPVKLCSEEGIELSVLKKAEEDNSLIVRVAETRGTNSTGVLHAPGASIIPTNMVEWCDDEDDATTGQRELTLKAFQISTFRVRRGSEY